MILPSRRALIFFTRSSVEQYANKTNERTNRRPARWPDIDFFYRIQNKLKTCTIISPGKADM